MARYFGGFRDRLKKRSKNQPISEKDVDWVQVATTFSWSPIRREHHWLEPEDYLSSFLDSDGEEHLDIEGESQGDGSVDHNSTPEAGYSDYELLDQTSSSNPISPDTNSFESAQEFHSDRTTQSPESSEVHKMRPGIDVPAELPLLDEYRFELLSALQRRGVRITIDKIGIPDDLEQHLVNYHEGNGSIDSYELRARLQQFKKQVIDSYESYQSLSDSMRVTGNATPPVEIMQQAEAEDEEDYESFILNSLNRLEATMRDEDRAEVDEGEESWDDGFEEWGEPSDTSDEPSIRSSRGVENNSNRTKATGNAPGKEPDSSFFTSSTDFSGHGENESWSDATLDLASEPSYKIRDYTGGVQDPSDADLEESDLDHEELDDASPAYNVDLLKALNTMGRRLPDDGHEEESTLDAELEDGELMQQINGRFGEAPADESADEGLLDGWIESEEELTIQDDDDDLLAPPSYVHGRLQDSEPSDEVGHNDDWDDKEEDRSTLSRKETSLSDLILQLRNDADHSIGEQDESDEFDAYDTHEPEERFRASSSMAKLAEKTVSLRISDDESTANVEDEPGASFETMDFEADMSAEEVPYDEESSPVLVESDDDAPQPAWRDYTSDSDDSEEERQRRIEREREKLFSIIDRLEKRARPVIDPPVEKDEETSIDGDFSTEQYESSIESHSDGAVATAGESEPSSESDTPLDELSVHDEPDEEVTAFEDPVAFDDTLIDIDVEEQEIAVELFDADESTEPHEMSPSDVTETPDMEIEEEEEAFAPVEETIPESDRPIESSPRQEPETMHEEWSDTTVRRSDSFVQNIIPVVKQENSATSTPADTDDAVLLDASDAPESASADAVYSDLAEVDEGISHDVSLEGVIEAIAFATEEPFALKRLARLYAELQGEKMPSEKQMMDAVSALNAHYEETNRAFRIKMWGGGIRMASHPQYAPFIRALYEDNRPRKLSRTLMETLAIIAYSQPTTKPEVDFVRGVDSDYAVRKLLELGLIDIVGRSEAIGRPLLYGTSERFLEQFGLSQLEALPKLREVEDLLGDPAFKKERLHLLALEGLQEVRVEAQDADVNESEPAEPEADEEDV